MDAYETNLLHEKFLAEIMMHVVPDAEQEEERPHSETENADNTTEEEPTAKKPKTGLGKLLGDMFTRPEDRTRMSIREKAELEMKRYLQEPSPSIDENPLNRWKQNHSQFPAIAKLAKQVIRVKKTRGAAAPRTRITWAYFVGSKEPSLKLLRSAKLQRTNSSPISNCPRSKSAIFYSRNINYNINSL